MVTLGLCWRGSRQLLIGVVSSIGNRPFGRQDPQSVPFLNGLDRDAHALGKLARCIHTSILPPVHVQSQGLDINSFPNWSLEHALASHMEEGQSLYLSPALTALSGVHT